MFVLDYSIEDLEIEDVELLKKLVEITVDLNGGSLIESKVIDTDDCFTIFMKVDNVSEDLIKTAETIIIVGVENFGGSLAGMYFEGGENEK